LGSSLASKAPVRFYSRSHGRRLRSPLRSVVSQASVVVLVADGVRPDTLRDALDRGDLPSLGKLRAEGALHTLTSVFPSVTGPAYAPFLMGRSPGPVGLPGLRWFDRAREVCTFPDYARSYVGHQVRHVDADLDPAAPTIFELCPNSVAALSVIFRGLAPERRIGGRGFRELGDAVRAARTHFRGDVRGWLDIDREVCDRVTRKIRETRPRFVFAAFTGVDKASHAEGHEAPVVIDALRIVDDMAGTLRTDAEQRGEWERTSLWVVSDHGHSAVREHEDLVGVVRMLGHRVVAHPWIFALNPDVAVMVSGNAMAHLYVDLARRIRPWWPALEARWGALADTLLERPSVDLLLLPHGENRCEVRARDRGSAFVERSGERFGYRTTSGDPLGIGRDLDEVDVNAAYEATIATDYPDSVVQIARLAGARRSGELILSASRAWDFRARYEPIPHRSAHGALHREHMLVPVLVNQPIVGIPRRTVDVMPSALAALGLPVPAGLEGESFVGSWA
jgi:type I phosphodiesterase/nucleotide pyrophosphatase